MQLRELTRQVLRHLPESLHPYCTVGNFQKGCLILITPDAVWASQLHYCLPMLREKLRKDSGFHQLIAIKVKIAFLNNDTPKTKEPRHLSQEAKDIILTTANSCQYDPLKQALQRLAGLEK